MAVPATPASSNKIRYYQYKTSFIERTLKNMPTENIQRSLVVAAVAFAILSLLPSTGWGGSLALRSVAFSMVGVQVLHSMKNKEGKTALLLHIARLASIALGITGVALHMNQLVIASIAGEVLFQAAGVGQGAQQKDLYKSLSHMVFVVIDGFVLAGMTTGMWQFMVTAASLSSAAMFLFALKAGIMGLINEDLNSLIDVLYYVALGGIGIGSAIRPAKIVHNHRYQKNTVSQYPWPKEKFPILPIGSNVVVTEDPRLMPPQTTSVVAPDFSALDTFLNPKLVVIETYHVREHKPMIELKLEGTELSYKYNRQGLCNTSETVKNYLAFTSSAVEEDDDDEEIRVEEKSEVEEFSLPESYDIKAFEAMNHYLQKGSFKSLHKLSEEELWNLFDMGRFMRIQNVEALCLKEMTDRLTKFQWENTQLLTDNAYTDKRLNSLVDCFDFRPLSSPGSL